MNNAKQKGQYYGEPWSCGMDHKNRIVICDHKGKMIVGWARRAAICVNACEGIPSEDLTPERVKKGIALAKAVESGDPSIFLTLHEVALRRSMQCKESGSAAGCGISGKDIDNE